MAYTYPTKINTVSADVAAVATALAQRQSDSATTNGGIVASGGSAAVPQLGADSAGLGSAYLTAIADVTLAACGVQVCDDAASTGVVNTTSSTLVDANSAYGDLSFTAPIAKSYLVHVDVTCYMSAGTPSACNAYIALKNVTTGAVYSATGGRANFAALSSSVLVSFRVLVPMSAGANTLRLQWRITGGGTLSTNTACGRTITVSG